MDGRHLYGRRLYHWFSKFLCIIPLVSVITKILVISGNSGNFGIAEQFRYFRYLSNQSDSRNTEPDTEISRISGISGISGCPFLRKLQGFSGTIGTVNGTHCLTFNWTRINLDRFCLWCQHLRLLFSFQWSTMRLRRLRSWVGIHKTSYGKFVKFS